MRPSVPNAKRPIAFVLATTAAATLLAAGPADAKSGPPALSWRPCAEAPADTSVQCARLPVPVDWRHPRGPRIELAIARRHATDPSARIGSLFFDLAGPGVGVDVVLFGTGYFSSELRRRFDLVGFDTRGAGRSHPLRCSRGVTAGEPAPVNAPLTSRDDFERRIAYNRRVREDCRRHTGPLYDHVDSLSNAHDLNAIRAALGEPKLSFYGVSYGTVMGQQYAEWYPHHVRAMVLDSVVDHSLRTRQLHVTSAASVQDGFDAFRAWSDRTPASALHGRDIRALWADLLARAARGELRDPFDPRRPLPPAQLTALADAAFWTPDWPGLADTLAALDRGGTALTPLPAAPPTGRHEPDIEESHGTPLCGDFSLPIRDYQDYARLQRRNASVAPDMRYSPLATFWTLQCLGEPARIPNPQHRLTVRHLSTPMLLVNARHDPGTSYTWATHVARQLGADGVLLTYDGYGHVTYGRTACTRETIDRYLITLTAPARGTHCPAAGPAGES